MPDSKNQNDVIFFLGAGASMEAGVPDTIGFIYGEKEKGGIQGFIEYLKEKNMERELKILEIILNTLQGKVGRANVDIELVLGTINALNRKQDFELVYFYNQSTFKFNFEEEQILKELESLLKGFIRKNVLVNKSAISYLAPLTEFRPISIFSVNYDTCIEMLSIKHKLRYTDGFDLYWNPELLDGDKFDIKLFKLHGSIMWYLTDYGNFVKLLQKTKDETDEIPLITDEVAWPFIVYPIRGKLEYLGPVGYLTNKLQKYLKETKLCIVAGYSFRDEYIKRVFFDSAKENENLTIILISPNAGRIFNEKLRYRDEEKSVLSPLSDKVICFNYPFGSVLKNNYLYQIKNKVPYINDTYSNAIKMRRDSGNTEVFKACVNNAIEVGHIYFIESIFEKELGISPPDTWGIFNKEEQFRISYTLAIIYLMNSDKKGKEYFEFLRDFLEDILSKGRQYFDLNLKLNKVKEKVNNKEREDEEFEINKEIETLEKDSDFYLWSSSHSNLNAAISSFNVFLQKQLELNPRSEYINLLESTSAACVNLIDIFKIRYETKYKGSEKIDIKGTRVEVQKKNDLERGISNLLNIISKFSEFYK